MGTPGRLLMTSQGKLCCRFQIALIALGLIEALLVNTFPRPYPTVERNTGQTQRWAMSGYYNN